MIKMQSKCVKQTPPPPIPLIGTIFFSGRLKSSSCLCNYRKDNKSILFFFINFLSFSNSLSLSFNCSNYFQIPDILLRFLDQCAFSCCTLFQGSNGYRVSNISQGMRGFDLKLKLWTQIAILNLRRKLGEKRRPIKKGPGEYLEDIDNIIYATCFFFYFLVECLLCFRYVIVKHVRKDHLDDLPVPNRIKQYLNTPFYYSEQVTFMLFLRYRCISVHKNYGAMHSNILFLIDESI